MTGGMGLNREQSTSESVKTGSKYQWRFGAVLRQSTDMSVALLSRNIWLRGNDAAC